MLWDWNAAVPTITFVVEGREHVVSADRVMRVRYYEEIGLIPPSAAPVASASTPSRTSTASSWSSA